MELNLEALKKRYKKLQKKYKLPSFNELNQEFEIEKIQEKETDFLLREIRKIISDKIAAFLRLFELFINPTSAPIFILNVIKTLTLKDKELIERIYHKLVYLELTSMVRDINYNEKKEVEFIKKTAKKWKEIKVDLNQFSLILERIKTKRNETRKSYFG